MQCVPHPGRRGILPEYIRTYFRAWWNPQLARGQGEPVPLSSVERRTLPTVVPQTPFGLVEYAPYRFFDPGADANGYKAGILQRNPIGAGVVFKNQLPIFPDRVGTYQAGAIFWSTNASNNPDIGAKLLTPQQLYALTGAGPEPGGGMLP